MFIANIIDATKTDTSFRQVLHTGPHSQLVVMSLPPGEEIGLETHPTADQLLFFVVGHAVVTVGTDVKHAREHDVVFVPAGTPHNVVNDSPGPLKLFTVYAPPTHADGTVHHTKADAELAEASEHGQD